MLVREALRRLAKENPDAELHFCTQHDYGFRTTEADEIYADTTQYGLLTDNPTTVEIVVLDTTSCGL